MKKRIITLLMVGILALSMPVYVLGVNETKISVLYEEPEIKVNVPTGGGLIINPYGLPITVDGKVQFAKIVNMPWSIENMSNVAVTMDVSVAAEVAAGSTLELSDRSATRDRSGDKLAFMFLDKKVTDPGVVLTDLNWFDTVYNMREHIVITEYGDERENFMTLAAANADGTTANGGVGAFHIYGDAAPHPDEEWDPSTDKVSIEISYTFRPTVPAT